MTCVIELYIYSLSLRKFLWRMNTIQIPQQNVFLVRTKEKCIFKIYILYNYSDVITHIICVKRVLTYLTVVPSQHLNSICFLLVRVTFQVGIWYSGFRYETKTDHRTFILLYRLRCWFFERSSFINYPPTIIIFKYKLYPHHKTYNLSGKLLYHFEMKVNETTVLCDCII